jgi:hypothetical protein
MEREGRGLDLHDVKVGIKHRFLPSFLPSRSFLPSSSHPLCSSPPLLSTGWSDEACTKRRQVPSRSFPQPFLCVPSFIPSFARLLFFLPPNLRPPSVLPFVSRSFISRLSACSFLPTFPSFLPSVDARSLRCGGISARRAPSNVRPSAPCPARPLLSGVTQQQPWAKTRKR